MAGRPVCPHCGVTRRPYVSQTTERWMATARLRLGYAVDKWLFFITGGAVWSGVDVTVFDLPPTTAHP
jgi:opacity protein-like surface antigen